MDVISSGSAMLPRACAAEEGMICRDFEARGTNGIFRIELMTFLPLLPERWVGLILHAMRRQVRKRELT